MNISIKHQLNFLFRVPDVGVEWPRVSSNITDPIDYLILAGPDDLKSGSNNDLDQTKFWNSIGLGGL